MMRPRGDIEVYLHRRPVDFRKAINGLALIVQEELHLDPYTNALFVFINSSFGVQNTKNTTGYSYSSRIVNSSN